MMPTMVVRLACGTELPPGKFTGRDGAEEPEDPGVEPAGAGAGVVSSALSPVSGFSVLGVLFVWSFACGVEASWFALSAVAAPESSWLVVSSVVAALSVWVSVAVTTGAASSACAGAWSALNPRETATAIVNVFLSIYIEIARVRQEIFTGGSACYSCERLQGCCG